MIAENLNKASIPGESQGGEEADLQSLGTWHLCAVENSSEPRFQRISQGGLSPRNPPRGRLQDL
jgi:hypothetical protein